MHYPCVSQSVPFVLGVLILFSVDHESLCHERTRAMNHFDDHNSVLPGYCYKIPACIHTCLQF